jgi:hypothetical protein
MLKPAMGTLRSFTINASGTITPVAGTPYMIPGLGGALGLWQHPKDNTLYVGFPFQAKVGVYNIDPNSGALTFHSTVDAGLVACWVRTDKSGDYMYVLNSGENSVSIYNSSNSLSPVYIDKLVLKNSGPTYPPPVGTMPFATSEAFHLSFSPSEKNLFIVSQHTNVDFSIGNYNYLHTLEVADDGRLTESHDPVNLPVAPNYRPQGVAVY